MDMTTLMSQINDALVAENGPNLAYLLRPTSPHGKDLVKEFRNPTVRPPLSFQRIIVRCSFVCLFLARNVKPIRGEHAEPMGRDCDSVRPDVHPYSETETWRSLQGAVAAGVVSVLGPCLVKPLVRLPSSGAATKLSGSSSDSLLRIAVGRCPLCSQF